MITTVVLTVLVVVGVVVLNAKKRASLPDWEATATASPSEFDPEMSAPGTADMDAEIADLEPAVTQAKKNGYKIVSERFQPSFYDLGEAHSLSPCIAKTTIATRWSSSFLNVCKCTLGTG